MLAYRYIKSLNEISNGRSRSIIGIDHSLNGRYISVWYLCEYSSLEELHRCHTASEALDRLTTYNLVTDQKDQQNQRR